MKNRYFVFLIFLFFADTVLFCETLYDIEYYNLQLKSLQYNYRINEAALEKPNKKELDKIKTYFEELYLYYMQVDRFIDEITIYKKRFLETINIPDGVDGNLYWNRKTKKLEYKVSYKFVVNIDIEKLIEGDDLNE